MLGILHINNSKDSSHVGGDEVRAKIYMIGANYMQSAFKIDNTTAAPCSAIANLYLLKGELVKVSLILFATLSRLPVFNLSIILLIFRL